MNSRIAGILLFTGFILCEITGIVYLIWPETGSTYYSDLYLNSSFKEKITVLYFLYELMPYLKDAIFFFVLSKVTAGVDRRINSISLVLMWYSFLQALFYVWDRNTSYLRTLCVYVCAAVIVFLILRQVKKQGKYRTLD